MQKNEASQRFMLSLGKSRAQNWRKTSADSIWHGKALCAIIKTFWTKNKVLPKWALNIFECFFNTFPEKNSKIEVSIIGPKIEFCRNVQCMNSTTFSQCYLYFACEECINKVSIFLQKIVNFIVMLLGVPSAGDVPQVELCWRQSRCLWHWRQLDQFTQLRIQIKSFLAQKLWKSR